MNGERMMQSFAPKAEAARVPCLICEQPIGVSQIEAGPWHPIAKDWFGAAVPAPPLFQLNIDPEYLWFAARVSGRPWHNTAHGQGHFVSGLWQFDVAEVFICDDTSPAYQEFNLSPGGAWWTGLFSGYRQPLAAEHQPHPKVRCFSEIREQDWQAILAIPRESVSVHCAFSEHSRINVSFITDGTARRYFSWAPIIAPEPDFHRSEQFLRLAIQPR